MFDVNDQTSTKPQKFKLSKQAKVIVSISGLVLLCCCGFLMLTKNYDSSAEVKATFTALAIARETTAVDKTTVVAVEDVEASTVVASVTNSPFPTTTMSATDEPIMTEAPTLTSTPVVTVLPTNTLLPTNTSLPTSTPTIFSTLAPLQSGGLGLFVYEWEQDHQITGLDWGIGAGYDNLYDVLFYENKVKTIYYIFDTPATIDDVELITSQLIPFDREYIGTYIPEGRPETTVLIYKSNFLATRFDADFWKFSEPGTFIMVYKTYEGFGIGDMFFSIDNNP